MIHSEEGIKLIAAMLYDKYEVNIEKVIGAPQQILALVHREASGYADMIR